MDAISMADLITAHLDAKRWGRAHPDLQQHAEARAGAIGQAFGIDLRCPPEQSDGLAQFLASTIASIEAITSPFDSYLEMPAPVVELWLKHGEEIGRTRDGLRLAYIQLAVDIVAAMWGVPAATTVSRDAVRAHGFDPDVPAPDPSEYW
jgi:hypothetical protein